MAHVSKVRTHLPAIQEIQPGKIFCNAIVEEQATGVTTQRGAGLWLLDKNMKILWMNDEMEEIYGSLQELRGTNCFASFRGRESRCPDCLPTKAFETGNIISGYVSRVTKDGTARYYQLVEAPLLDGNDQVSRVLEIVLDVTEKARLENSMRRSERQHRALFENAATAVVMTSSEGIIERVNPKFEELSGYKKEEVEGQCHYVKFIHPKDRDKVTGYDHQRRLAPETVPTTYEFLFVNRWGHERMLQISVNLIPETGQKISSLVDITDKWKLEKEIGEKDQFLANVLRNSAEAIIGIDANEVIRSWNHGAELMFGYTSGQIVGKKFSTLHLVKFRRSRKYGSLHKKYQKQGFLRNEVMEVVSNSGRSMFANITRTSISDELGRPIGSSIIMRDITESRRNEQRMIQQEKMLALGELAASLAHEVKNPLNSMVINMEVLKSHLSGLSPEKQDHLSRYFQIFSSEIERLNNVMRGVLDFAKPIEAKFSEIDLTTTLLAVMELVAAQARQAKIELRTEIEPNVPRIDGAQDHLKQIFLNLILNAFQAMPEGGRVTVRAFKNSPSNVSVSVTDTGVGIPNRNLRRIFDLYFSTKEKGSGLGLPLAKRLVTAHGGDIQVKSRRKHGSTFTITFPSI